MSVSFELKLELNKDERAKLFRSMKLSNKICNFISEVAFQKKCFKQFDLHKLVYHKIRGKFPNFPSQFVIRCIAKVSESYCLENSTQHFFKKLSCIELDSKLVNFESLDNIAITTCFGRIKVVKSQFSNHLDITKYLISQSAKLKYSNNNFYLILCVHVSQDEILKAEGFLGVDLGIVNLAVTSDG